MPTAINKQILTFDTSVARPRNFQIFRGETVVIECALTNYINPIDLTGMTASAYWRSKAMAEESSDLWYNGTVEIVNGKVVWTWETSNDDGSDDYEWFIKVTGSGNLSYRAFGHIGMLGSPSTNPSIGPTPQSNYYTKDETDAHISQATEHLVPDTREINGHDLTADINLTASDVGALPDTYVAPVASVNGKTGTVSLTASDVGALPDSYSAPVASVNSKTGAVVLTASDVGALPDSYSAPVTSVNGKTGIVTLTASDVGAATEQSVAGKLDTAGGSGATDGSIGWTSSHRLQMEYTTLKLHNGFLSLNNVIIEPPLDSEQSNLLSLPVKNGTLAVTSDITTAVSGKQDTLTFDNAPTANSSNPVTSDGINTAITVNDSFSEWTFTATPSTGISNISASFSDMESCWIVSATLTIDGQSIPAAVPTNVYDPNALSLTATFSGQETWVVSGTRELVSRIIGNQTSKPLQPAGDYLPLSGGTVDWLHVDSIDFNVDNLLSVTPDSNGKMGGLFLGSDIRDESGTPGYNAPIIIGNAQATYGMEGFSFPNVAIGNDSTVEPNGIVIGGACGRKYEYDLGIGSGTSSGDFVATPIFNPKRQDFDLNDLVFVDENGDPVTPEMIVLDKIYGYYNNGMPQVFSRHGTNNEWGYYTQRRVGPRIQTIWVSGGTFKQNALFFYQRFGNVGGNIKLKFDPDPINSIDHSAAAGFSLAIGNDTMAGGWISSDVFNHWNNPGAIAIGHGTIAKDFGTVALGTGNLIQGGGCIGIGFNANTSIVNSDPTKDDGADTSKAAIQIGTGTNSTPRSLQYEDTTILSRSYDETTQTWSAVKLNSALLPDELVDQTELNTAISTATSGLATQTALTTAISAVEAEIPEVVSPYTSNSSGKAADAQDTGNALKTKATSFQPYRISNCVILDNYWHQLRVFIDETNGIGIVFDGTGFIAFGWPDDTVRYDTSYDSFDDILTVDTGGTVYNYSVYYSVVATLKDIPAVEPETWNFTLEDGTTLTKSVAVY